MAHDGPHQDDAPIGRLVVMGVSGAGKTTVGEALAAAAHVPFVDGDDLHPEANVRKMASGTPLTDADRAPWLARVGEVLSSASGIVVTCSALRRVYRDAIRRTAPDAVFVQLDVDPGELDARMRARRHHYMPASLLPSQLATLEPLGADEPGVVVDASGPPADVVARVRAALSAARAAGSP
ncbi:MAG TPA: gluconokinase [Solirubrobacteraceae bacterium]|nr:gluconokinase [Solirubrobacteraceae bacterium]